MINWIAMLTSIVFMVMHIKTRLENQAPKEDIILILTRIYSDLYPYISLIPKSLSPF